MKTNDWLPIGILPGMGWLLSKTRNILTDHASGLSDELFETAFCELEEQLLEMESDFAQEEPDGPFGQLWFLCEDVLEGIVAAWEEGCQELLDETNLLLAQAYHQLSLARALTLEDATFSLQA
jgi:hypothetical protein